MTVRATLLSARAELHEVLRASEEWQPSYKKDRATFAMLLKQESQLNTAVAEYLKELGERAPDYVDWSRMPQVAADNDPVANNDDDAWSDEQALLTAAVIALIIQLTTTGTIAGEALYGIPLAGSLDEAVLHYARTHTAELVTQVTKTNRKLIREAVRQSIAAGETTDQAKERLMKVINNPVRAEMIAQTESVNAYQGGLAEYAKASGAKSKTWDALVDACQICAPAADKTIEIDELFVLGDGEKVSKPPGHPRCRCGVVYNY